MLKQQRLCINMYCLCCRNKYLFYFHFAIMMYNMGNTYWILYKYWFNIILENQIFSIKWIKIYFHVFNYEMIELKLIFQVNKQYFIYLEHHVSRCLRLYVQKSFSCAILWNSHINAERLLCNNCSV